MKILVLGGKGTVGLSLVTELKARGHDVTCADRSLQQDFTGDYHKCDIGHFHQLERVLWKTHEVDYVYNLAAEFGRWNGEDYYESLWQTNVIGFKHLLRLQDECGFRLIHFSSSEVYGDYSGLMTEDVMDRVPIRQLNDYAMTKWVNEQQVMNSAAMYGTETVRVRLFNTYGPGEYYSPYRSAICIFCYSALMDKPYTVYLGHQRTSTYITDVSRTLANIVDHFIPGEVYNIGGTSLHDMKTVSDMILSYLGKSDSLVTYKTAEPFTTTAKRVDVSKAIRDLDHRADVPLAVGLVNTLQWMQRVYNMAQCRIPSLQTS